MNSERMANGECKGGRAAASEGPIVSRGPVVVCILIAGIHALAIVAAALLEDRAKDWPYMLLAGALGWTGPVALALITGLAVRAHLLKPAGGAARGMALCGAIVLFAWTIEMPSYWHAVADIEDVERIARRWEERLTGAAGGEVPPGDAHALAAPSATTSAPAAGDDRGR